MDRIGFSISATDRRGLLRDLAAEVADCGGSIETVHIEPEIVGKEPADKPSIVRMHLEVSGVARASELEASLAGVSDVLEAKLNPTAGAIFGKRVIVMGGGAQVAQVVLGAVSEADRHNIRGERISVDTIPLVGEEKLAEAIRAVGRLPRAKILVLAGSLMGGEVSAAVRELQDQHGIPVISLNMVGSVPEAADLVVSDPVQAGVMAVMAIAETARFDLSRVKGRRL